MPIKTATYIWTVGTPVFSKRPVSKKLSRLASTFLFAWLTIQSCQGQAINKEMEKREAAAGFMLTIAMELSVLRLECHQWLAGSSDDADDVAHKWWLRNRDDLDTANWIVREVAGRFQATLPNNLATLAVAQLMQTMAKGNLGNLRGIFKRQLPTPDTCRRALQPYKTPQFDIRNIGNIKGFEQFSEFGQNLASAGKDPDFQPAEEKFRTFDAQLSTAIGPVASLDAIEFAKENHDTAAVISGLKSLALRGDIKAALTLGTGYLNSTATSSDKQRAVAWFYNAWSMGSSDGINSLGVMARDGLGMPPDPELAISAFALAKQMAVNKDTAALQRATTNYSRLSQQASTKDSIAVSCSKSVAMARMFRDRAAGLPDIELLDFPQSPGCIAEPL
ncbi:MAG: hypothetical protein JWP38_1340 [Herbaspirillum sp.]|nr:hypothetical protein [Herbaspirillum sp.]